MRLIDADKFRQRIKNSTISKPTKVASLVLADTQETIDPVHATNSCYCKECWYYTEWGECKEFGDIMKPNEFCSRGKITNVQM